MNYKPYVQLSDLSALLKLVGRSIQDRTVNELMREHFRYELQNFKMKGVFRDVVLR